MAKEISLADIEPAIEIFKAANIQAIQKVVARAEKKAMSAGKRQRSAAKGMMRQGKVAKTLTQALGKAMDFHGRQAKERPSIRLTAPDTGGRPYHFGYTVITKGQRKTTASSARRAGTEGGGGAASNAAAAARGKAEAGKGGVRRNARHRANTREGAHQIYTERDAAVEAGEALDDRPLAERSMAFMAEVQEIDGGIVGLGGRNPGAERETDGPEAAQTTARQPGASREESQAWVEEGMSLTPGLSERHGEAAAQRYIEDEAKLPKLRGHTASFGTIGDTIEERLRFWDLVHENESEKGGRTQSRLVLELPHEASPRERHEIVRRYTDDLFRSKGLPYWVSIHAPTKENDSRNHHAHVVFTDRPASKMIDPSTGKEEWDFAITAVSQTKCRHNLTSHPHRQNRREDMRDRGWVKRARSRFAEITNDVMIEAGRGVRYDPRSYKDMGLDASPMKNVKRIITDKAKDQTFVVMDAEWTRRMIDLEMRDAAIRRSATFQAMVRNETLLEQASKSAAAAEKAQARLPAHLRMGMPMRLGTALSQRVTTAVLEGERERLGRRFVEEATERTLRNVMDATRPQPKGKASGKVHDAANAPDMAALAELHEAAREELAAHRRSSGLAASAAGRRMAKLREAWGRSAEKPLAPPPAYETRGGQAEGGSPGRTTKPVQTDEPKSSGRTAPSATPEAGTPPTVPRQPRAQGTNAPSRERSDPLKAPRLAPRLVPNLTAGGLIRSVSEGMAAMVADFHASGGTRRRSLEEQLEEAAKAERVAETKLAAMDAADAAKAERAREAASAQRRRDEPPATRTPPRAKEAVVSPASQPTLPLPAAAEHAIARETAKQEKPETRRPAEPQKPVAADTMRPAAVPPEESARTAIEAAQPLPRAPIPEREQARTAAPAPKQEDMFAPAKADTTSPPTAKDMEKPARADTAEEAARKKARRKAILARNGRGGPSR